MPALSNYIILSTCNYYVSEHVHAMDANHGHHIILYSCTINLYKKKIALPL